MNNAQSPDWKGIFSLISQQRLLEAIALIKKTAIQFPMLSLEEVSRIEEDYRIMLHYAGMGFNDPERDNVYQLFIHRLYRAAANMRIAFRRKHVSVYAQWAQKATGQFFTHDSIRRELEDFVATKVMLSLETEETRNEKEQALYQRHQAFLSALFCKILVAPLWTEADGSFFSQFLLSPTIDANDALLIVSAVTMANLQEFDSEKFSTLLNIYQGSENTALQQRALVGWAFSVHQLPSIFPEIKERIDRLCADEQVTRQLTDMQKQVIFCMEAEKDHDTIQRDIMPSLMRNSDINITRNGMITEKEDDPLEDILDPHASDRRMEELEATIQKMIDMQKAGSDIYFGGFAQMKRTQFFYDVSNWFCPFYKEHPAIHQAMQKVGNTHFLDLIVGHTPLCDSDKYSLLQAFASVIDRLPQNIREFMNNGIEGIDFPSENGFKLDVPESVGEEKATLEFLRRFYLQDLYRFFRLYHAKSQLVSPFAPDSFLFITHLPTTEETPVKGAVLSIYDILRKRNNIEGQRQLTQLLQNDNSPEALLIRGIYAYEHTHDNVLAKFCMKLLLEKQPGHEKALLYLARASFQTADYEGAEHCYAQLCEKHSEKKSYQLNHCIAQSRNKHYDAALPTLYKLNYEHPDDTNILRVLAWTLLGMGRQEQAREQYEKIMAQPDHTDSDLLNYGYCLWIAGEIPGAVKLFRSFLDSNPETSLYDEFQRDNYLLADNHISSTDQALVIDLVVG